MAGLMSGVLHAPLTGIFLIAEITGGYTLFLPLMTVSAIAFITTSYFEKHSIYTKHLIEKGDLILRNKDKQVLSLLKMKKFIEKDFKTIHPDATLADLNEIIQVSKRNIFPVISSDKEYMGYVNLDDVRKTMFDQEKCCSTSVSSIMHKSDDVILMKDDMNAIMGKFEHSHSWNLPVVDKENIYIGFMSKSNIFNSYRKKLIRQGRGDE
jgi:CIC family chloride channel protein